MEEWNLYNDILIILYKKLKQCHKISICRKNSNLISVIEKLI